MEDGQREELQCRLEKIAESAKVIMHRTLNLNKYICISIMTPKISSKHDRLP